MTALVISIGATSAFGGYLFGMDHERNEDIKNAIEANDYEAWKAAMSARLTEDNFNRLVERQEAMSERREQREAIMKAIESEDYEAFQVAAEDSSIFHRIQDKDDFKMLVQLHQAKQDRDFDTVRKISEQLGWFCEYDKHTLPGYFGRRMI